MRSRKQAERDRPATFDDTVSKIRAQIRALRENTDNKSVLDQKFLALHERYLHRFLADNQTVWVTASVMIPVALSAFGVYSTLGTSAIMHAAALVVASTMLLLFWLICVENLRALQDKSMAWMRAIEEEIIGVTSIDLPDKIRSDRLQRVLVFRGAIKWTARVFCAAVLAAWGLVLGIGAITSTQTDLRSPDVWRVLERPFGAVYPVLLVTRVLDGDTFEAWVHVAPRLAYFADVRVEGVDTPEMTGPCKAQGERVRAEVEQVLRAAKTITVQVTAVDQYGRWVCQVLFDGQDLAGWLRDNRLTKADLCS